MKYIFDSEARKPFWKFSLYYLVFTIILSLVSLVINQWFAFLFFIIVLYFVITALFFGSRIIVDSVKEGRLGYIDMMGYGGFWDIQRKSKNESKTAFCFGVLLNFIGGLVMLSLACAMIYVFVIPYSKQWIEKFYATEQVNPIIVDGTIVNDLVFLAVSSKDIGSLVAEFDGKIVSQVPETGTYEVRFPVSSLEEVDTIANQLRERRKGIQIVHSYIYEPPKSGEPQ